MLPVLSYAKRDAILPQHELKENTRPGAEPIFVYHLLISIDIHFFTNF